MGYLGTWAKRRKITISNTNIDSNLSHFPVCIRLGTSVGEGSSDVSDIFDEVGSNDKKIAVTKSDGTTQLYVEIEKWDATAEEAVLWVSKSDWTLPSSTNTDIYMYFDSTQSDNTTYVADAGSRTEVWGSDFKGVWHLGEDPSGTAPQIIDSTSNNNNGTSGGSMTSADVVSGQTGDALDFDGSNDYIEVNSILEELEQISSYTISFWMKIDSLPFSGHTGLFGFGSDSPVRVIWIWGSNNTKKLEFQSDTSTSVESDLRITGPDMVENTWYHIVLTWNGTTAKIYYNNSEVGNDTTSDNTLAPDAESIARIGEIYGHDHFNGLIDEIQITTTSLSAAFRKFAYNNQSSGGELTWSATENLNGEASGTVTLNSSGVSGATVRAINQSTGVQDGSDTTDVNGDYTITGLSKTKNYHIIVEYEAEGQKYNAKSKWDITPVDS